MRFQEERTGHSLCNLLTLKESCVSKSYSYRYFGKVDNEIKPQNWFLVCDAGKRFTVSRLGPTWYSIFPPETVP